MAPIDSLSDAIRRSGVKNKELAKRFGVTSQAVSQWKAGSSLPSPDRVQDVIAYLQSRVAALEGGHQVAADLPPLTKSSVPGYVPVRSLNASAGAGGGGLIEDGLLGYPQLFEEGFVTRDLRARPEDLCVVEIEGQSMEPLLRSGDTVLVDMRKKNVAMEGIFVVFDGDGVVCKWVEMVRGLDAPTLRIKSENDRFPSYDVQAERCQILGRVVWFSRRL
ncbi:S24 family peptidase [Asaia prunellae]|uniref:S24 family peptidase n=1 Tax=Asaia prunellae TaxID=610245 RepID=UPI000A002A9C|nr:S24 family peptidase [Asaia prunellae]